ncbi:MAG TPA: B-box zinc finger protein, partial [bacterium]|nr:B-box zinc finger protein [bacterium]
MAETFCVKHGGKPAVGYCSKCNKPYCEDCLDMETGKPVCQDCLKAKATQGTPAAPAGAMGGSPLNFKGKGLDDDPLGLFGAGGPKVEAPKLVPTPPPFKPPVVPPHPSQSIPTPKPMTPPTAAPMTPPMSKPVSPMSSLDPLGKTPSPSEKPAGSMPKAPMDLDSLIKEPQPMRPPFPQASSAGSASGPVPQPFQMNSTKSAVPQKKNPLITLKIWVKYLLRRAYDLFDPLAVKLRVPTYIAVLLVVALVAGSVMGITLFVN